jgi:dTMP kinase
MKANYFPGFLVAIEGIDGAGKTTQSHLLQAALQGRGLKVARLKEPTDRQYGQMLRDSAATGRLSVEEEVDLFIKDRKQHVDEVIIPALREGTIVIMDRYYFSTVAYQGARGVPPLKLLADNEAFAPEPDLLFVLDIDPKAGLQRIKMRGDRANHFEVTATLKKARAIFRAMQKPYMVLLDASWTVEEVHREILLHFNRAYTEAIAASNLSDSEKLNATLKGFGGDPIT